MPIVTDSRFGSSTEKLHFAYRQNGARINSGTIIVDPWSQTTTGWRSGRQYLSEDQRYESMTGAELRANIRNEYARRFDTGHNFSSLKTSDFLMNRNTLIQSGTSSGSLVYSGPVVLDIRLAHSIYPLSDPLVNLPSPSQITKDGTQLWSMAAPTAAEAGLAAFLGELREGLPRIPGRASAHGKTLRKSGGEEYLNWKFGIKPLESDLKKLASGILDFHERVKQYQRDSGKVVRRRRHLSDTRREVDVFTGNGGDVTYLPAMISGGELSTYFYDSLGSLRIIDVVDQSVWFAGAYSYYLSEAYDFLGKMDRYAELANHALGTDFNVDTAWQLTPWSWMVDWFSDTGTFIKNIVALSNDSLVARYAYVMHRTTVTRMCAVTGMRLKPGASGPTSISAFRTIESKKRTSATPYGFGVDLSHLSVSQSAILGALGLTRSPGVLRNK
jgi:hypothetical protein